MRRLMDIGMAAKRAEVEIEEHSRTLLKARLREEVLTRRVQHLKATDERKTTEEEALEVSIGMRRKATGKHGVLE